MNPIYKEGTYLLGVLYISYDGILEPLGQSQVLPYLEKLSDRGARFILLSFEKPSDIGSTMLRDTEARMAAAGIRWIPLRYHKRPVLLATGFDLLNGMLRGVIIIIRERVGVVHCRSYVAALIGWLLKRWLGVRFLFDMRGFWADERVEGGLWRPGCFLYRLSKRLERRFLKDADEIVTLTERARSAIESRSDVRAAQVSVIPTCVDLKKFSPRMNHRSEDASPVFIYTGSVGTWYLLNEMLRFVEQALRRFRFARLLLLTRNREEASREIEKARLATAAVTLASVPPAEIPTWLARAHAGLAFYKPGLGRQGTCPTKVGEYLAMGLPVVVNDAVGDMEQIIGGGGVGTVLSRFTPEAYDQALQELERLWADPMLASRCRSVAESHFSLEMGAERYWEIYQRLSLYP